MMEGNRPILGRPRVRGSVPWVLCKRTAKLLSDAARITERHGLVNIAAALGEAAAEWREQIDRASPPRIEK